jgi:ketosteroid isomerase-like protein
MAEHPNVAKMRRGYDAFSKGDMGTLRNEIFAPDVVFHIADSGSLNGDYKGVDEVLGFLGKVMEITGGNFGIEVHDILANDEHGVALVQVTAQREERRLGQKGVHVFHIRDGSVAEHWSFAEDTAESNDFFS